MTQNHYSLININHFDIENLPAINIRMDFLNNARRKLRRQDNTWHQIVVLVMFRVLAKFGAK